jgi:cell division protein FtsQ
LAAGAVVALWALWTALAGSQLFEIKTVDVRGASALSAADVIERAAVPSSETLLRVDAGAIEERLLEDPWVARASVSRRFPSTLRITVTERVPAAIVDTGVSFWFVESSGRVLAESVVTSATTAPVIRDLPDFVAEPGVTSDSAALRNALGVLSGLSADLRSTVRSITAPSVDETTLLTSAGVEIMVGEAVDMTEKSAIIADILATEGSNVVFIDVRSIERPISRGLSD